MVALTALITTALVASPLLASPIPPSAASPSLASPAVNSALPSTDLNGLNQTLQTNLLPSVKNSTVTSTKNVTVQKRQFWGGYWGRYDNDDYYRGWGGNRGWGNWFGCDDDWYRGWGVASHYNRYWKRSITNATVIPAGKNETTAPVPAASTKPEESHPKKELEKEKLEKRQYGGYGGGYSGGYGMFGGGGMGFGGMGYGGGSTATYPSVFSAFYYPNQYRSWW